MDRFDIIVVGGGAAGMIAAGHAAERGAKVLLLEKMDRPGLKIGITGKGRCNLTNTASIDEFMEKIKPDGRFLRNAFNSFFSDDLIEFLNNLGIKTVKERGGRVFPDNINAIGIRNALTDWCKRSGVKIENNFKVTNLLNENKEAKGIEGISESNNSLNLHLSNQIIISTGGMSYPATGSDGDGYELAKSVGHSIIQPVPSLVPLESDYKYGPILNDLTLRNVRASIFINGIKLKEDDFGDLTFTRHGITGPIALNLSRIIVPAIIEKKEVIFSIDLKPALNEEKLNNRLIREFNEQGKEPFRTILNKLLPKQLITVCIEETKISWDKPGNQISAKERQTLNHWLKNFDIKITHYRPFKEAIVTAGGVDIKEINPKNMESKIIKGLHFAGEVINLDGPTGGYNLQIAFSTGWLAADSIIKK